MQLLPTSVKKELGWTPLFWLVYLGFLFIEPVMNHESLAQWLWLAAAMAVFLPLYRMAHMYRGGRGILVFVGMVLLGVGYTPFNGGAVAFFIYAASMLAFIVPVKTFVWLLGLESAIIALETWLLHLNLGTAIVGIAFSIVVGATNLHFAEKKRAHKKLQLAHDEIEHLAKVAERERIARDLHDVLGHTLSLITLKSELAGRLLDKNSALQTTLARKEIHDIEQTARHALAEVRQAIVGYRAEGFADEVERAQRTLEAAGVQFHCETKSPMMPPAEETVLSLALREAVTNIVRHSQARTCRLRLSQENNYISLIVEDDGRGGVFFEGNGLRGMRERVEACGGYFTCEGSGETRIGTRITLGLPVKIHSEAVSS